MIILFIGLLCLLVGYRAGYEIAHMTIARECERLGGFYVDSKTYKCHLVQDDNTAQQQGDTNE